MAIARVQATPVGVSTGSTTLTFSGTPTAGNLIVVPIISFSQSSPQSFTVTDNKGNTYHLAEDSGNFNGSNTFIYYAYNITSSATFTITVTMIGGSGSHGFASLGIEFSGMGSADPLVGDGGATNSNPPTCTTGTTGVSDVAVVAAMSTFQLNFAITAIAVDGTSPSWFEEYERLSGGFLDLSGEIDSRIITGSGGSAQAVTWTITSTAPGSPSCAIAVFAATQPPAFARVTQISREQLELDGGAVFARVDQISREVAYPFTCNPTPTPQTQLIQIRRQRRFLLPSSEDNKRIKIPTLELLLQGGVGLTPAAWGTDANVPQGANPKVMMRISKDGGKTWGPERWRSAGTIGRYLQRVRWLQATGSYRNAVCEITVDDPVDWQFLAMMGTPEEGSS